MYVCECVLYSVLYDSTGAVVLCAEMIRPRDEWVCLASLPTLSDFNYLSKDSYKRRTRHLARGIHPISCNVLWSPKFWIILHAAANRLHGYRFIVS